MNRRIAIGAVVVLLASLAFAAVASASDGFEDGDYTIFLPEGAQVDFTITDGAVATDDSFSDDENEHVIRLASGDIEVEIDADDASIEISGLTPEQAATVTVAFDGSVYSQENLPEDWEIVFDGDGLTDDARSDDDSDSDDTQTTTATTDDDSADDDARSDDDDDSSDDDARSDDDDSDSDDTQTTTATTDDSADDDSSDDARSDDDDSDSDDTQTTTATTDDSGDDDSADDDSADDDSNSGDDDSGD